MKSIVLLGVSRAGKSTFAQMLSKELKSCRIISGDLVRLAYRDEILQDLLKWTKNELEKNL